MAPVLQRRFNGVVTDCCDGLSTVLQRCCNGLLSRSFNGVVTDCCSGVEAERCHGVLTMLC